MRAMPLRAVVVCLGLAVVLGGLGACTAAPTAQGSAAGSTAGSAGPVATPAASEPGAGASVASSKAPPESTTAPAAHAPSGSFVVKSRIISLSRGADRPLPTTVWYPAIGSGPFPVIVFGHGLTSEPSAYSALLIRWAKAGFVVAAPSFPHTHYQVQDYRPLDVANQPADMSYVLGKVVDLNAKAGDPFYHRLDPVRVAAAGHSAGAITTIGLFTTHRDQRLTAGIVLSGEQVLPAPFTGPSAPILFVHGKLDKTVPYANGVAAYKAVPWPKALMTVTQGGHVAITKDFGPVLATTTDWWRWTLYGDLAARNRLKADATRGGTSTLATSF